jgi:hypothetical protein
MEQFKPGDYVISPTAVLPTVFKVKDRHHAKYYYLENISMVESEIAYLGYGSAKWRLATQEEIANAIAKRLEA